MDHQYFVYILANQNRRTYIGVTNSLERRMWEHKTHHSKGHASRYNKVLLVYFEEYGSIDDAIAREKQLKKWSAGKKAARIESMNLEWIDLSIAMFDWVDESGNVIPVE